MNQQLDLATCIEADSSAIISDDGQYRYWLTRRWAPGPICVVVMLNPSTADAKHNDHTIRKLIGFSKRWGFSGFVVVNLFAWRDTSPQAMMATDFPIGPENDAHLKRAFRLGAPVIAAWGAYGIHKNRDVAVLGMMRIEGVEAQCLGLTKGGRPLHPLMVGYDTPLVKL